MKVGKNSQDTFLYLTKVSTDADVQDDQKKKGQLGVLHHWNIEWKFPLKTAAWALGKD